MREHYTSIDNSLSQDSIINYSVTYDGTWQKRGFTSLYGIGFVIELYTGIVIDYEILSKYCRLCTDKEKSMGENSEQFQKWLREHQAKGECQKNFDKSSGAMEAFAAEVMWKRSIENCNARYVNILSDGDAKTFQHLNNLQVYGPDVSLVREQCINHVSKSLVTAMKNLVKESAIKKITLGGRKAGALTAKVMTDLAGYYRNAIVKNTPHVHLMRSAVLATLDHYDSTDEDPKHALCPIDANSWCWYQKALASGVEPPSHSTKKIKLNSVVIEHLRPMYQKFSNVELLQRCIRGGTQNTNESLHHMVWSRCSKDTFQSKKRLEISVICAVSEFNMGCENSLRLRSTMDGECVSEVARKISIARDTKRLDKSKKLQELNVKRSEKRRRKQLNAQESKRRKQEGPSYAPGGFVVDM